MQELNESWEDNDSKEAEKIRLGKELTKNTKFNNQEKLVIIEKLEEVSRSGQFERIFPIGSTFKKYMKYLKCRRACNIIMFRWLKMSVEEKKQVIKEFKVRKNQEELFSRLI